MIVVMTSRSSTEDAERVVQWLGQYGSRGHIIEGAHRRIVEVLESGPELKRATLAALPAVERILTHPEPLLATERDGLGTRPVAIGRGVTIGGERLGIIAGPCSVEDEGVLLEIAHRVADAGAVGLRGGAFKPRTSPYAFQGLERRGLEALARAREATGLAIITEVRSPEQVPLVAEFADVLQIGSRNMHNAMLLKAVGGQQRPVLLKRGWSATLDEYLLAAEYVLQGGNPNVVLCERGIRTHEDYVRNTLALSVVPEVKLRSPLPIIVDPSHGTGRRHLVAPMSRAAIACGADGLIIEVHTRPDHAWSDAEQTIDADAFASLMADLKTLAPAFGRSV